MVPNTPPPPSDKEKEAHENAGEAGEGDPISGRFEPVYDSDGKFVSAMFVESGQLDENGWISVKERLPEVAERVLVRAVFVSLYFGDSIEETALGTRGFTFDGKEYWRIQEGPHSILKKVTHWMPLPNPPKNP